MGSVARAIALIDALASEPGALGVNELARRIDVTPSTASRLLATLEQGGLTARAADGRYTLGLRLLALADHLLTQLDMRELARPHLHALVAATDETATLSVPTGGDAVTVDFVPGNSSVISMARIGRPNPAHATAIGKTLLAFGRLPEDVSAEPLGAFTDRTITDQPRLARAVADVRTAGWAEAVGEREADLAALAAPVFGARGQLVAIIGLQGPLERITGPRRSAMLRDLLDAARELSVQLGADHADLDPVALAAATRPEPS